MFETMISERSIWRSLVSIAQVLYSVTKLGEVDSMTHLT